MCLPQTRHAENWIHFTWRLQNPLLLKTDYINIIMVIQSHIRICIPSHTKHLEDVNTNEEEVDDNKFKLAWEHALN